MEYVNFHGCGQIRTKSFASYDYDEALKFYEFFLQHVSLPDTEPSQAESLMNQLGYLFKDPTVSATCK